MSPTKKKTPAPKKAATAKKAAAPVKSAKATKSGKTEKPAAKKPAAKPAPTPAAKKAPAAPPPAARKPEKAAKAEKPSKAEKSEKVEKGLAKPPGKAVEAPANAKVAKGVEAKSGGKTEPAAAKAKPAPGKKSGDEVTPSAKRAKPRKPVVPTGPRHPKLGFRWSCDRCGAKFYDLGKEEPLCPKCSADQRDRPADEPRPPSSESARPRVVRPMAQLLDDDEPAAPLVEDDLGLDDVVEAGDMFEGDGDIAHLELDAAELEAETIEAGEPDEF